MGFICKACGTNTFTLRIQPSLEQPLHITTNEFADVLITVGNNTPFQADLGFMNRFASCASCGAIKQWQYHQTNTTTIMKPTPRNKQYSTP